MNKLIQNEFLIVYMPVILNSSVFLNFRQFPPIFNRTKCLIRHLPHLSYSKSMKKAKVAKIREEPVEDSEYFSPRKLIRNQRRPHVKVEYEAKKLKLDTKEGASLQKFSYVPRKEGRSAETEKMETEEEVKWEPGNWRQTLNNIKEMREKFPAPVDTMGCDKCADETADEKTQRYHCLLSLMLSSQTKDQVTYDAMNRLKSRCKPLVPSTVLELSDTELEELLKPVSFYRVKAKHIKMSSQMLIEQYDSDIPDSVEGLLKLPGVGKKMAFLAMKSAWNKVTGIGVDTHVHRISNWLKWVKRPTKTPEDTRLALESWLPQELWDDVNHLMVGFGQTVCHAIRPKCDICANASICPAKQLPKKSPKKTPKNVE